MRFHCTVKTPVFNTLNIAISNFQTWFVRTVMEVLKYCLMKETSNMQIIHPDNKLPWAFPQCSEVPKDWCLQNTGALITFNVQVSHKSLQIILWLHGWFMYEFVILHYAILDSYCILIWYSLPWTWNLNTALPYSVQNEHTLKTEMQTFTWKHPEERFFTSIYHSMNKSCDNNLSPLVLRNREITSACPANLTFCFNLNFQWNAPETHSFHYWLCVIALHEVPHARWG